MEYARKRYAATGNSDALAVLETAAALPDSDIDIAETALALAVLNQPGFDLAPYRSHLAEITAAVRDASTETQADTKTDALGRAAVLASVLTGQFGYSGNVADYDDLQNANLTRVIDRRRGLPIALSILYLHAARSADWQADGINFPGHFLISLDHGGSRLMIDPFNGGNTVTPPELRELIKRMAGAEAELTPNIFAPAGNRDILLRLQNNLKLRLLRANKVDDAAAIIESMILVAPSEHELWREAGTVYAHIEDYENAIPWLEVYLAEAQSETGRQRAREVLRSIRSRFH